MKQLITLTAILLISLSGVSQTSEQDSLALQLSFQAQDTTKVNTSILLIESFYNSGDYRKAQSYIDETEKLSSDLKYKKGDADIMYFKALIYAQKDDYYNALDYYDKSLNLYKQLRDSLSIAKVNNNLSLIEIKRGNFSKGLKYSLSAIGIFERKNLKNELSLAYNNLAEAYYNTNRIEDAITFNLKALEVREQILDTEGIKNSTNNIASLYSIQKEHRKAIEYYNKVLDLVSDSREDREMRGDVLSNLGDEYLSFNDFVNAEKFLVQGLRLNRTTKNKKGILKSLNGVARINIRKEKVILAQGQIDEAFAIAREINDDDELLKNYKLRIDIDLLKKNYRRVIRWQTEYYDLREKIRIENTPVPIINIEEPDPTETNFGEEEPSTTLSNNSEAKTTSFFKNPTYLLYGLIGALALLVISIIIAIAKVKNKDSHAKKLEVENNKLKEESDSTVKQISNLEETNFVKDRLFSIVSHDLKDSITSIKAFLDLLKEDSISKKEFDELIPELSNNADNASALLLNLLNWSKSQMQNLDPKPELFNIQDVFNEKISLIKKKAEKKKLVLINESYKDFIFADRSMIEIVVQNLLANAVKFSSVGDVITVSNRQRNGHALISIEDTGVGISKENQEKLFKNQGFTTQGTDHEKGTGLGLSICKQLIELNKGSIWVESEPNLGSRFYVELPKSETMHEYYKNIEVNSPVFVKAPQS
ncbi:ATP-binding protein [Flavobacteriaceae bacterium AU392]|nr:ATP-binding protein [Flavobacteriaceae bacterium]RKM86035.1 ATP-binding protein [Flavobacteriaceae bacterium AU392]